MPDIYTSPELIERKWKTRARKIIITNPPSDASQEDQKEVIFDVEDVPYDNNIPKYEDSRKKTPLKVVLNDVITETFTIFDPVTRQNVNISVAGIATAIEECYVVWQNRANQ
jgi:hypothetical protein